MNLERWRRLQELFEVALDLPREERSAYLDRACGGDGELRAELERLLAAQSRAAARQLFEQPPWEEVIRAGEEPDPMIGKVVGNVYHIRRKLGAGGFGEVYLAVGQVAGREAGRFVVKFARRLDEDQQRRFDEEVRINAELKHENIAPIHHWGEFEGRPFLVVEYIEGGTLGEYIRSHAREGRGLEPSLVAEIARQACAGIQSAHDRGVIHRDVKPQNIMIQEAGGRLTVKVIDFGLAKSSDGITRRPTDGIIGSFNYIAPEQIAPEKYGPAGPLCDVYAMGLVIYEMLTGRVAVTSSGAEPAALFQKQLTYTPPPPGISQEVDRVVLKAMRKDPRERQPSIRHLAAELTDAVAELNRARARERKGRRVRPALLFGLLGLLLLGAGGVGWRLFDRTPSVEPPVATTPTPLATPTAPAPPASPQLTVFVKNSGSPEGRVAEDWREQVFTSRDQLRLTIDPPGDGLIYLVQRGTLDDLTLLYPDRRIAFARENSVQAGTPVIFPPATRGEPNWFAFSKPGVEIIYVVYVRDRTARLARLIEKEWERNQNSRNRLGQVVLDKGIEALLQQAIRQPIDDRSSVTRMELRHIK
jgi:serine/threonine protein kinase